jgi:hypothetical protein
VNLYPYALGGEKYSKGGNFSEKGSQTQKTLKIKNPKLVSLP